MSVAPFSIGEYECLITSTRKLVDTPEYMCFSINKYSRIYNGFDKGIHFKVFPDGCEIVTYVLASTGDDFDDEIEESYDSDFYAVMPQSNAIAVLLEWLNSVEMEDRMQIIEVMNTKFLTMPNYKSSGVEQNAVKGGA